MLSIEDVGSRYAAAHILRQVSLHVPEGAVVALLGRNGMGKTTLVRTVAGMRPPQLSAGRILLRGTDISALPSYRIAQLGVGIVPQGRHVFASLTVRENLTVTARPPRSGPGWTLDRVFELFPRLAERISQRARTLSGGEQQMLAIARALMTNPAVLLMDEPSEGLAPVVVSQIRERIEALKGSDLSILLVEQNLGFALKVADRIYVLGEHGRIVWEGEPSELAADSQAKRTHLGV